MMMMKKKKLKKRIMRKKRYAKITLVETVQFKSFANPVYLITFEP